MVYKGHENSFDVIVVVVVVCFKVTVYILYPNMTNFLDTSYISKLSLGTIFELSKFKFQPNSWKKIVFTSKMVKLRYFFCQGTHQIKPPSMLITFWVFSSKYEKLTVDMTILYHLDQVQRKYSGINTFTVQCFAQDVQTFEFARLLYFTHLKKF